MTRMPKIYSGISVSANFSSFFDSLAKSPCKERSSPKLNGLSDTIQSDLKSLDDTLRTTTIIQSNTEAIYSSRLCLIIWHTEKRIFNKEIILATISEFEAVGPGLSAGIRIYTSRTPMGHVSTGVRASRTPLS